MNYIFDIFIILILDTENNDADDNNFVNYCLDSAWDEEKIHRPHFIFTSMNRECLPGVKPLDFGVLSKKDAIDLIKKELITKNTNKDVKELAKTLQYFPSNLLQAIKTINRQNEIKGVSGQYGIQDYLAEWHKKSAEANSNIFPGFSCVINVTMLLSFAMLVFVVIQIVRFTGYRFP